MPKHGVILLLVSLIQAVGFSQNMIIDSLESLYSQATDRQVKVDLLIGLGEAYQEYDYPKALALGYDALSIAKSIAYQEGVFYAYNTISTAYNGIGPIDSAYLYNRLGLDLALEMNEPFSLAIAKNNMGIYYLNQGNYPLSLQYFQEALEHDRNTGEYVDPTGVYANIGILHEEMGDTEKAIEYYLKSADAALAFDDKASIAYAYLDYGYVDAMQGKRESAMQHYENALALYRELNHASREAETLYYIGEIHLEEGKYEQALSYQEEALAIYERIQSVEDVPSMYSIIAGIYKEMGDTQQAISYYQEAISRAKKTGLTSLLPSLFKELSLTYVAADNYRQAYEYEGMFRTWQDSFVNSATKERIAKLETTYELQVQEAENKKLNEQQEQQRVILRQRTLIAIAASLITILVFFIAIIQYRANRQKAVLNRNLEQKVKERTVALAAANQKLLESNDELERFTFIASHDLKEPLRNITSFINLIQKKLKDSTDPDLNEYMGFVVRNTRQLYGLVEDILTHSRVEANRRKTSEKVDLNLLLLDIRMGLNRTLEEKNAVVQAAELPPVLGYRSELFLLLKNLIENGLKYNESAQPTIKIDCKTKEEQLQFSVADNGIGIDPSYHDRIFEMFTRLNNRSKYQGYGIGLATCRKIVQKYKGEMWVESQEGQGSTFFFTLPKLEA